MACLDDLPVLACSLVLDALGEQDKANVCLTNKAHNSRAKYLLSRLSIDQYNAAERLRWFPGQVLKTVVCQGNELPRMLSCIANSPHVSTISTVITEERICGDDLHTRLISAFTGKTWSEPADLILGLKQVPALKHLVMNNPKHVPIGVLLSLGLLTDIPVIEFDSISFDMHMQPRISDDLQAGLRQLHDVVRQQSKRITAYELFVYNRQLRFHIAGNSVLRHLSLLAACLDVTGVHELRLNWMGMNKPSTAMAQVAALFPNIMVLHLRACRLSNSFLLEAVQGFPYLTEVCLNACKSLTDGRKLAEALMMVKLSRISLTREPLPLQVEMSRSGVSPVVVSELEAWVNSASPNDFVNLKLT